MKAATFWQPSCHNIKAAKRQEIWLKQLLLVAVCGLSILCVHGQGLQNIDPFKTSSPDLLSSNSVIRPLKVGEQVPHVEMSMLNYSSEMAQLSDFKEKLIILDFWATWCVGCIKQFPKMDSLQKQFGDRIQVLLVNTKSTQDTEQKVKSFFAKTKSKYQLPTVMYDTKFDKLFPHRLIPHCVIITPGGKVHSITSSDQINARNIQMILDGGSIILKSKKDIDAEKPLFISEDIEFERLSQYSIFLKGKINGLTGGNRVRRQGNSIRGRAITNTPLLDIYKTVVRQLNNKITDKLIILEVKDSSGLIFSGRGDKESWFAENLYNYELIVPLKDTANLYNYMLEELNKYSGYYGVIEKRKVKCLALTIKYEADRIHTQGGKTENRLNDIDHPYLQNAPMSWLVAKLNIIPGINQLVIDETGYSGNVDIRFFNDIHNTSYLKKRLNEYLLELAEIEKEVDVFVIKEK